MHTTTGLLISARSWSLQDERTGEERSGTTIHIASEQSDHDSRLKGFNIQKMTGSPALFATIDPSMAGKKVAVQCEISQRGTQVKLIPQSVELVK